MKLYNITFTSRNKEKFIGKRNLTGVKAEKECEEWGWMFNDGKESFYMGYEESTITTEVLEVLQNSFLADLYDALEVETDINLLDAIREEIARRK